MLSFLRKKMKNKTIVLFDHLSGGHHETYILLYAKTLLELGNKVLIFYPEDTIFSSLKDKYGSKIKYEKIDFINTSYKNKYLVTVSNILKVIFLWIKTNTLIKKGLKKMGESTPDLVFFLWLDSFLGAFLKGWIIDLFFKFKWSGLYFHPVYLRTSDILQTIQNPESILKSRFCSFVTVLDENISNKLSTNIDKKVYVLPDVTDEELEENDLIKKSILFKANNRKVIGILGIFSKRKGLETFIDAIKMADQNKFFFVIAGDFSKNDYKKDEYESIESFLKKKPENCFIIQEILSEKDFNTLVNSCDILFAVYKNFFHSSNILTKAALFKKYVIVSDKHLMAERVKKFNLGLCIKQENVSKLLRAMDILSTEEKIQTLERPLFEEYFSRHSTQKLAQIFSSINI